MKRWAQALLLTVAVALVLLVEVPRFLPGPGAPVKARAAEEADVVVNGLIEGAAPEVALRPEVQGVVAAVRCRENQEVARGAVLIEISDEAQRQQVALAEAEFAMVLAERDRQEMGERRERRDSADAEVRARAAALESARAAWKRAERLSKTSLLSEEELDRSYHLMKKAEALKDQARAEQALVNAAPRPEDRRIMKGRLVVAEARLALARVELAKTRLTAPCSGRILRVWPQVGELVGPTSGQPAVMLANLSKRRVRAFVEELDALRVRPGQSALVAAEGLPGKELAGVVALVMPRMGKRTIRSGAPDEYQDLFFREVLIDLAKGEGLVLNLRVRARIKVAADKTR